MIKTLRKLWIEGNFLNLIKDIYKKPIANRLNDERRKGFLPNIRNMTMMPAFIIAYSKLYSMLWPEQLGKKNK